MIEAIKINRRSGIYAIVNMVNGKIYVGSSVNLYSRKQGHLLSLRKGTHHTISLQRAFNKYGEDNFSFDLIELVEDKNKLIEKEQKWIDFFNPKYNSCRKAGSTLGIKLSDRVKQKMRDNNMGVKNPHFGMKHSEEVKKRISELKKGCSGPRKGVKLTEEQKQRLRGRKHSLETKLKMKKAWETRELATQETRQKRRQAMLGKRWKLSEETKQKIRISIANRTEEQKIQIIKKRNESFRGMLSGGKNPSARKVINLQTGIFYGCIKEAWNSYGVGSLSYFTTKLRDSRKNNTPFIYVN